MNHNNCNEEVLIKPADTSKHPPDGGCLLVLEVLILGKKRWSCVIMLNCNYRYVLQGLQMTHSNTTFTAEIFSSSERHLRCHLPPRSLDLRV